MSYLLLAEKQQLLLLQNAESKPTKETHTVEMATRKPRGMRTRPQPRQNRTWYSLSKPKISHLRNLTMRVSSNHRVEVVIVVVAVDLDILLEIVILQSILSKCIKSCSV